MKREDWLFLKGWDLWVKSIDTGLKYHNRLDKVIPFFVELFVEAQRPSDISHTALQSSSPSHPASSAAAAEVLQVYKKSGRSGGDLAGFDPERAIIKAMCNVVLKSLE